ncbi:MAG: UDP-N-acetylmuramoyl-L-alanine--D-glutamate ligase [Caldimicrobium sp.]
MDLKNKKVVVIGFGRSGQAATRLLLVKGAQVIVSESKDLKELHPSYLSFMKLSGVEFETGGHKKETLQKADLVVVSPGVPFKVYKSALEKGVPVIGELELAYECLDPKEREKIISITGTNGKTTTTAMISELMRYSGYKVFTGGNYGIPLSELVLSGEKIDWIVLEVSSFQLETIKNFSSMISLLLNITPDHLERYTSLEEYAYYKYKIFENQTKDNYALLPWGEPFFERFKSMVNGKKFFFAEKDGEEVSAYYNKEAEEIVLKLGEEGEIYPLSKFKLFGHHNRINLLCALLAGRLMGAGKEACLKLIEEFRGFPHRLEFVGTFGGITFINDSKATNVDATLQALKGLPGSVVLILGGRHKGASYAPLIPLIQEKVRVLILMGEARLLLQDELSGLVETYLAENLVQALEIAFRVARAGDIVLLSPACSSFDQFRDYQERGNVFKNLVIEYAPKYLDKTYVKGIYH